MKLIEIPRAIKQITLRDVKKGGAVADLLPLIDFDLKKGLKIKSYETPSSLVLELLENEKNANFITDICPSVAKYNTPSMNYLKIENWPLTHMIRHYTTKIVPMEEIICLNYDTTDEEEALAEEDEYRDIRILEVKISDINDETWIFKVDYLNIDPKYGAGPDEGYYDSCLTKYTYNHDNVTFNGLIFAGAQDCTIGYDGALSIDEKVPDIDEGLYTSTSWYCTHKSGTTPDSDSEC